MKIWTLKKDKQRGWVSTEKHEAIAKVHCIQVSQVVGKVRRVDIRITKEKGGRKYNHYRCCNIDRPVACVLQSPAPAEGCVASEVLVVFSKLCLDNLLSGVPPGESGGRFRGSELLVALVDTHLCRATVPAV